MNTTPEQKFCAVTYDNAGVPLWYWLGTKEVCERRTRLEWNQDIRVSSSFIDEVDPLMTWDQMRDLLWTADPNAKGRVIWSGTWEQLEVK
jgi:hypothetical protein